MTHIYIHGKFNINGRAGKVELRGNSAFVQIDTFKKYSNIQRLYAINVGTDTTNSNSTTQDDVENAVIKYVNTGSANLNVRAGAGTNFSVVGTLPRGTQVMVYEELNGWSRIGQGKWVSSQYLADGKPAEQTPTTKTMYVKVKSTLNVRAGAGTNYKVVGSLSNGAKVTVYAEANGWSKIGEGQWVSSQYLVSSNPDKVVVSTVGQKRTFKSNTTIYKNSNLTGTTYNYKAGTTVKILQNISSSVDKIYVIQTGRTGYVNTSVYK